MDQEIEKLNAQLTKYFQKVIINASINYYNKKFSIMEKELLRDSILDECADEKFSENQDLPTVLIFGIPFFFENEKIIETIENSSKKEKIFLVEKFVFCKTDREIAETLRMTRQGVTNLKHRFYSKFPQNN